MTKPILTPEQALIAALANLDDARPGEHLSTVMFGRFSTHTDTPNGAWHSLTFVRKIGNTAENERRSATGEDRDRDRHTILGEWRRTYYPTEAETAAARRENDTQE